MMNILEELDTLYREYEELNKHLYEKTREYCEILNEKYKNQIGEKIETVNGGQCSYTFFGGFKVEYISHYSITPILYYPTVKNTQSKRQIITVPSYTRRVINELESRKL